MAAQRLKRVMKNRCVATVFQPRQQLREGACRLVADSRQIGNGDEFERGFCRIHVRDSFPLNEAEALSRRGKTRDVTRSGWIMLPGAPPLAPSIRRESP